MNGGNVATRRQQPDVERTLPHNPEAERSVIGSILLDNRNFNAAAEVLVPEDFFSTAHRAIYTCMTELSERSDAIDSVTLREELERRGQLEDIGGPAYLAAVIDGLPRALNVEHYARIVKEKASLRRLIASANDVIDRALEGADDPDEILDRAERAIFEISESKLRRGFVSVKALALEAMGEVEELHERGDIVTGLPTGFDRLNYLTSGFQGGDLIIIAGRPSMGKTAFALNVAQHVAVHHAAAVGIFSLEMSSQQLIRRLMTAQARVDAHKLATGFVSQQDVNKLLNALAELSEARIFIDDTANLSVLEMRAKARRLKMEHGLDLLIVDYLQLMGHTGNYENRNLELGAISRSLKGLAKELDVPVLALSQLSRAPEERAGHRPQLSDLRECVTGDTLVQLADGRNVPIERLVGATPEVMAMSTDGRMTTATSDKVWSVGRREVWSVGLASGRSLRATPKHRLYGAAGWVRVEELDVGDRIAIPRHEPSLTEELPEPRMALRSQAESDVVWDRLAAIQPHGEEEVFDLTVPGPACWVANSVISHNSGNLEQDADLVGFIFRPEVYSDDADLEGVAELIVAKQRNGPTGNVHLAFLKPFTLFKDRADVEEF